MPHLERLCWLLVVGLTLWCGYQLGFLRALLEGCK